MYEHKHILIVDDTVEKRDQLAVGLKNKGYKVCTTENGEQAIEMIEQEPQKFNFVLIDHFLGEEPVFEDENEEVKLDGIETCDRIYNITSKIIIVIYSNIPTDNSETIMRFKRQAYRAGAVRYMRRDPKEPELQIDGFIKQINDLALLTKRLHKFYEFQKELPSLLTHLKIGTMLIDEKNKIWYTSPEMKKILGMESQEFKDYCAYVLHGFQKRCKICPFHDFKKTTKTVEKITLLPIRGRGNKLRYFKTICHPIISSNENQVIAIMKSIHDITDSDVLKSMPVQEKLGIVAQGLLNHEEGFNRVIIYIKDGGLIKVSAACGFQVEDVKNRTYNLSDMNVLDEIKDTYYKLKKGLYYKNQPTENIFGADHPAPSIFWPIMDGNNLLGLIVVNGDESKMHILEQYACEAKKILTESGSNNSFDPDIENLMVKIENKLMQSDNTEEAIRFLIQEVAQCTNSISSHVRYRDGDLAILLPINTGNYPQVARKEWYIFNRRLIACRVLMSGQEHIINDFDINRQSPKYKSTFNEKQLIAMNSSKSIYCLPLFFTGNCIGVLILHSEVKGNYNQKYQIIIKRFANKLSVVLHDYLIKLKDKKKTELIENLAHELNTPLASLILFSRYLTKANLPDKESEIAQFLYQDSQRYARMVQKLLYHSRIESDILTLNKQEVLLTTLIKNCIQVMEAPAQKKNINIIFEPENQLNNTIVYADSDMISETIINLLDNAIKFTPKNGDNIRISLSSQNEYYCVNIIDRGTGISENVQKRIFDKYNQGDEDAFPNTVCGSGIGLAIVKYVIEAHDGNIELQSELSKGSNFSFTLPKYFKISKEEKNVR